MMNSRFKTVFAILLLAYFILYVVSPVSAAVPSEKVPDTARQESGDVRAADFVATALPFGKSLGTLKSGDNQLMLFLYDLMLWDILKKGRHSDNADLAIGPGSDEQNASSDFKHLISKSPTIKGLASTADELSLPYQTAFYGLPCRSQTISDTYLPYSDLSPPFLS